MVPVFQFSTSANRTFSFLQDMAAEEGLRTVPSWKAHTLTGNRKGTWNLLITKDWRMTFRIDRDEIEIIELDYEDYHWEVGMSAIAGIRMKSPAHPGSFVKSEIIEPLGLSVTAAAQALGVTRATLSTLLNEHSQLSPDMALRVEKAFGVSMDTLMRLQNSYDIAQARRRAGEIDVAPYQPAPAIPAAPRA